LRPDGYVALAAPTQEPAALAHYFTERGLRPGDDVFSAHPSRPAP
jgi:hypothetical protein